MKFEKSVTRSSRGKPEVRILRGRGRYCIVSYRDLTSGKDIENKFKIYLEMADGVKGFLFIKLKEEGKYLVFEDKEVKKDLYVYNAEKDVEEPMFP